MLNWYQELKRADRKKQQNQIEPKGGEVPATLLPTHTHPSSYPRSYAHTRYAMSCAVIASARATWLSSYCGVSCPVLSNAGAFSCACTCGTEQAYACRRGRWGLLRRRSRPRSP
eukprot:560799-Rhodomonas_salina.5